MSMFSFSVERRAPATLGEVCRARAGVIRTPHGDIKTPAFVPVATKADVKGVLPSALKALGAQVLLANTYHLYLTPGEELVKAAGGLARFMNWGTHVGRTTSYMGSGWKGMPTMTDSGGFQVFSLGAAFGRKISKFTHVGRTTSYMGEVSEKENQVAVFDESVATAHGQLAVIDDEGVTFTSHHDGSLHRFTPERSVEIQHALGADMFFAFDECTSPTEPYEYQREAMFRTHRWARRSLQAHRQKLPAVGRLPQAIFGIVQGGRFEDLRKESAREIASLGFDGIGIGGSFSKEDMRGVLQAAVGELPEELPRHFLGIGEPGDILEGIASGMDLFDCVAATRIGRHGSIYTKHGIVHLTGERFRSDFTPLSHVGFTKPHMDVGRTTSYMGENPNPVGEFTLAYVAHLIRSKEMLGSIICSMHNLGFILSLVDGVRKAILDGRFDDYRADFMRDYYHA